MIAYFKRILTPPVFSCDDDKTRSARVLNTLLISAMIVSMFIFVAIPIVYAEKFYNYLFSITIFLILIISLWLMRRGQVRLASTLFISSTWIFLTVLNSLAGGMTSITAVFHIAIMVIAGLLLGIRAAIFYATACSLTGLVLITLETNGYPMPRIFPVPARAGWLDITFSFILTITALSIAMRSITNALADARQSEAKYRTLIENSNDAIFLIYNRKFEIINRKFVDIFGYTLEEINNPNFDFIKLIAPKSQSFVENLRTRAYCNEAIDPKYELTMITKDNREIEIETSVTYFDYKDGIASQGIIRDITDRKRVEAEIRNLNDELEQRVIERTAQLEAVNNELKDFASIVSHDLKAPLRAVNQLATWIYAEYFNNLDDTGKEYLNLMKLRVKRMDLLIEGILQYSRIGREEEQQVKIFLAALIDEVIETLAPPESIKIDIQPELPVVIGSRIRIMQVFQNLIGNAIKYMDKPQGLITITCERDNDKWIFKIIDNGPGIKHNHFDRIFQIFQTGEKHDDVESTGIGLTLVKKIVEYYGGNIWVESEIGTGSTFFFTLPKE
ncbi:PAS domain S-box protein [candidate division KSB1 bacterium]|nr:PAS domain S-box protein [candidate division KSB1 bacterium]